MTPQSTSVVTLTVDRTNRLLVVSGKVQYGQPVAWTVRGHTPSAAGNLTLWLRRGATVLQGVGSSFASAFVGSVDSATATMATFVSTIEDLFDAVADGAVREFELVLWDSDSGERLGNGSMKIYGSEDFAAGTPAPDPVIPPSPAGWVVLGDEYYKLSDNTHWRKNQTTGKLRQVWLAGAGTEASEVYGDTEIDIPT